MHDYIINISKSENIINFSAQYQTSDLDFLEQCLQQHACFYFWKQKNNKAVLYLSDNKSIFSKQFTACILDYKPFNTGISSEPVIFEKSYAITNSKTVYYFKSSASSAASASINPVS